MSTTTENRDPAAIERDIRYTQDEISRTVDRIGDQLTPRSVLNALLDKAESNEIDGRALLDGARRNPLALAMLAGGAIWLVSDSDAKVPSGMIHRDKASKANDEFDPHHRDYITHMERVEMLEGEDPVVYQRRRDIARANFLMCERRPDEDESSFRQRLDSMTEKFRDGRRALRDRTGRAAGSARDSARSAASATSSAASSAAARTQDLFASNPLVGGLAAAAVGAILGSVVPLSETEEERLSGVGEKAHDLANEQKDRLSQAAREQKDNVVDKAEEFADRRAQDRQEPRSGGTAQSDGGGYEPPLQQAASHDGTIGQQQGSGVGSPRQPSPQGSPGGGQRR